LPDRYPDVVRLFEGPGVVHRGCTVEYEIEVEELKDRKRGLGRLAIVTLLGCALLLLARQIL